VDPVLDPLLLTKSSSAGNRTPTSGSVARNSDHLTTAAVHIRDSYSIVVNICATYRDTKTDAAFPPHSALVVGNTVDSPL
jgi:hypothetical protein